VRYDIPSFWHTSLGFNFIIKLTYKVYKLHDLSEIVVNGIDFVTIHTGVTLELAKRAATSMRVAGVVSRGGTIMAAWSIHNDKENPLLSNFDYLVEMAKEFEVVLSLGDALRPGGIQDSHDELQIQELVNNSRLARKAVESGVQVMIEGPGHMPWIA